MHASELQLIGVLWAIWFSGWLLAGLGAAKTVVRQSWLSRLSYVATLTAGAMLIMPHQPGPGPVRELLFTRRLFVPWLGLALVVAGLAFTAWARWHLGRFWSGSVTLKEGHLLIRSGPYGWTRHPIYTGLLVAILGTAVCTGALAAVLGIAQFSLGIVLKIRFEEQLLSSRFGAEYQAYRKEVRMLVPGLW